MSIKHSTDLKSFSTENGEMIEEIWGSAVGGTKAHSIAKITLPKGKSSLKHYHPIVEETYFLLSGKGRMILDNKEHLISAGDSVLVQPNVVHQIFNDEEEHLVFIATCSPSWTPDCSVFLP